MGCWMTYGLIMVASILGETVESLLGSIPRGLPRKVCHPRESGDPELDSRSGRE